MVIDPDEARETADEILSRPAYREPEESPLERAVGWFFDTLGDLLEEVLSFAVGGSGGYLFGYLILVAAVGGAGYLAWRLRPRRHRLQRPATSGIEREVLIERSRGEWLTEAGAAESGGDWDRAVHARYHALVVGLADGGEVPAEPSTTSGEHRRAFARSGAEPARLDRFGQATDAYEHIWFGGRRAGRVDSEALADDDRFLVGSAE